MKRKSTIVMIVVMMLSLFASTLAMSFGWFQIDKNRVETSSDEILDYTTSKYYDGVYLTGDTIKGNSTYDTNTQIFKYKFSGALNGVEDSNFDTYLQVGDVIQIKDFNNGQVYIPNTSTDPQKTYQNYVSYDSVNDKLTILRAGWYNFFNTNNNDHTFDFYVHYKVRFDYDETTFNKVTLDEYKDSEWKTLSSKEDWERIRDILAIPTVNTYNKQYILFDDINAIARGNVYCYYWGSDHETVSWPGIKMTADVDKSYDYALIPSDVTGVVFNNGNDNNLVKTNDLRNYTDENKQIHTNIVFGNVTYNISLEPTNINNGINAIVPVGNDGTIDSYFRATGKTVGNETFYTSGWYIEGQSSSDTVAFSDFYQAMEYSGINHNGIIILKIAFYQPDAAYLVGVINKVDMWNTPLERNKFNQDRDFSLTLHVGDLVKVSIFKNLSHYGHKTVIPSTWDDNKYSLWGVGEKEYHWYFTNFEPNSYSSPARASNWNGRSYDNLFIQQTGLYIFHIDTTYGAVNVTYKSDRLFVKDGLTNVNYSGLEQLSLEDWTALGKPEALNIGADEEHYSGAYYTYIAGAGDSAFADPMPGGTTNFSFSGWYADYNPLTGYSNELISDGSKTAAQKYSDLYTSQQEDIASGNVSSSSFHWLYPKVHGSGTYILGTVNGNTNWDSATYNMTNEDVLYIYLAANDEIRIRNFNIANNIDSRYNRGWYYNASSSTVDFTRNSSNNYQITNAGYYKISISDYNGYTRQVSLSRAYRVDIASGENGQTLVSSLGGFKDSSGDSITYKLMNNSTGAITSNTYEYFFYTSSSDVPQTAENGTGNKFITWTLNSGANSITDTASINRNQTDALPFYSTNQVYVAGVYTNAKKGANAASDGSNTSGNWYSTNNISITMNSDGNDVVYLSANSIIRLVDYYQNRWYTWGTSIDSGLTKEDGAAINNYDGNAIVATEGYYRFEGAGYVVNVSRVTKVSLRDAIKLYDYSAGTLVSISSYKFLKAGTDPQDEDILAKGSRRNILNIFEGWYTNVSRMSPDSTHYTASFNAVNKISSIPAQNDILDLYSRYQVVEFELWQSTNGGSSYTQVDIEYEDYTDHLDSGDVGQYYQVKFSNVNVPTDTTLYEFRIYYDNGTYTISAYNSAVVDSDVNNAKILSNKYAVKNAGLVDMYIKIPISTSNADEIDQNHSLWITDYYRVTIDGIRYKESQIDFPDPSNEVEPPSGEYIRRVTANGTYHGRNVVNIHQNYYTFVAYLYSGQELKIYDGTYYYCEEDSRTTSNTVCFTATKTGYHLFYISNLSNTRYHVYVDEPPVILFNLDYSDYSSTWTNVDRIGLIAYENEAQTGTYYKASYVDSTNHIARFNISGKYNPYENAGFPHIQFVYTNGTISNGDTSLNVDSSGIISYSSKVQYEGDKTFVFHDAIYATDNGFVRSEHSLYAYSWGPSYVTYGHKVVYAYSDNAPYVDRWDGDGSTHFRYQMTELTGITKSNKKVYYYDFGDINSISFIVIDNGTVGDWKGKWGEYTLSAYENKYVNDGSSAPGENASFPGVQMTRAYYNEGGNWVYKIDGIIGNYNNLKFADGTGDGHKETQQIDIHSYYTGSLAYSFTNSTASEWGRSGSFILGYWSSDTYHSVTYVYYDTTTTTIIVEDNATPSTPNDVIAPARTGYIPNWYINGNYSTTAYANNTAIANVTTDVVYKQVYKPIDYTISYTLNGGTVSGNPTTYTIEDNITLNNPTKAGYTFTGWTGTGLDSASTSVTISEGSYNNRSYTATWKLNAPTGVSSAGYSNTYDGASHNLTVTFGNPANATPTYVWYKNGVQVGTGSTLSVKDVADSDDHYSVKVTLTDSSSDTAYETSSDFVVSITARNLSIAADNKSITYGDSSPSFTYTATGLQGSDSITGVDYSCSYSQYDNQGAYTISIDNSGISVTNSSNYNITYPDGTLTVNKKSLTITAASKSKTYGDSDPSLTYTSNGLVGTDTLTGALTRTYGENVGEYDINQGTVTLSNNKADNYSITYTKSKLTINKADLSITANAKTITYGDTPTNDGVTYSGFVRDENENDLSGTLSYAYSYSQYGNVGSYNITPSGLSSSNYDITFVNGTLTVEQKEIGLSWGATTRWTYDSLDHAPTCSATNTVNGDSLGITISGETSGAGNHAATATGITGTKAANYKLPSSKSQDFVIDPATLTFTANETPITYGDSVPTVTSAYSVSGWQGSDASSANTIISTAPTFALSGYSAGTNAGTSYTVAKSNNAVLSNGNYVAVYVPYASTVALKSLSITAESESKTYGDDDPALTYTVTGLVNSDKMSGSLTRASGENVNTYLITRNTLTIVDSTGASNKASNYDISFTGASLTINRAPLTINADTPSAITYGDSVPTYTATATGLKRVDKMSSPVFSCDYDQGDDVGSYSLTVTSATIDNSSNYDITYNSSIPNLVVNNANLTVSATNNSAIYTGSNIELSPTSKSASRAYGSDTITWTYSTDNLSFSESIPQSSIVGVHTIYYRVASSNHNTYSGSYTFTISYSITFANGTHGTVGGTTSTNTAGANTYTITNATTTIPSTGYSFTGWSVSNGTYNSDTGVISSITNNVVVTAQWAANTYTVTLNNQSATSAGSPSVTATYDASMPSITLPTKTGYAFDGYYTGTSGSGTKYYNSDGSSSRTWNLTSDTILYANWVEKITIQFTKGGDFEVSNMPDNQYYNKQTYGTDSGTTFSLPSAPSRTGYTFSGWYATVNATEYQITGTMKVFNDGIYDSSTMKASATDLVITLTAKWTINTSTITFTPGNYITSMWLSTNSTATSGSASGTSFDYNSTVYLFATISADTDQYDYSISGLNGYTAYNTTGNTWRIASFVIPAVSTTKAYGTVNASRDTKTYTITISAVGGSVNTTTINSVPYGSTIAVSNNTITINGTTSTASAGTGFNSSSYSWNVSNNATTTTAATYTITYNPLSYNITYKDQGDVEFSGNWGSTVHPTTHTYNTVTTLVDAPNKTGYTFAGWYTTSDCDGDPITSIGATEITDNITLYAQWERTNYTVTFTKIGEGTIKNGNSAVSSISVPYETVISRSDNGTVGQNDAYTTLTFKDPDDDSSLYVIVIKGDTNYKLNTITGATNNSTVGTSGLTIASIFAGNVYTVTYKDWSPIGSNTNCTASNKNTFTTSYTYGEGLTLPVSPTKSNVDFDGWYTDVSNDNKATSILATDSGNKTFYAKWVKAYLIRDLWGTGSDGMSCYAFTGSNYWTGTANTTTDNWSTAPKADYLGLNGEGNGVFVIVIPEYYTTIIFKNGSKQTSNISTSSISTNTIFNGYDNSGGQAQGTITLYSVAGTIKGIDCWNSNNIDMKYNYKTERFEAVIDFNNGDAFKIREFNNWSHSWPGSNQSISSTGTYLVQFKLSDKTVSVK